MSNMQVAETIRDQIKMLDRSALFAYGAKDFVGGENFLRFKVSGMKCKHAYVMITLDPSDTYSIKVFKFRRTGFDYKETVCAKFSDVYAEDLVRFLDSAIEGKDL